MLPGDVLEPEPTLEQNNSAIEIEGIGFRLLFRNRLPRFSPGGEVGGRKEPRGKPPLFRRRPHPGRREADQPLDETEQQREIAIETLGFARAREPVDKTMEVWTLDLRKGPKARENLAIELDAAIRDEFERAAHAALAERERGGERLVVDLVFVALERGPHGFLKLLIAQACHAQRASARANRHGKPALGVRDEKEQRPRRRLFERFQDRVCRVLVQLIGAIDEDDAPAPLPGRMPEKGAQAPHLIDADRLRVAFRLLDPRAPDEKEIGMRQRRDLAEHRMVAIDIAPLALRQQ